MKTKPIFIVLALLLFACGGSEKSNEEENLKEPQAEVLSNKIDEETLNGSVKLSIGQKEYNLTEFNKKRSEITWMKDNQINMRLTSLDKEQTVQLLISGPDVYKKVPIELSLDAQDFQKTNHGSFAFLGFLKSKDEMSTVRILKGSGTVEELDQESLDVALSFEGTGIHSSMGNKNDTIPISGNIQIQLDNADETRKNQ